MDGDDTFSTWGDDSEDFVLPRSLTDAASRDLAPRQAVRRTTLADVPLRIRPTIVLFGDSLTEYGYSCTPADGSQATAAGWVSLLSDAYCRRADVLNRGFSGYNTNLACRLAPGIFGMCPNGVLLTVVWFA
jgi:hypothetical protein